MTTPSQSSSSSFQPLGRRARNLFQVTFSDQSMAELNKLPVEAQLKLVDKISSLTSEQLEKTSETLGMFHRDGRTFYRVRVDELRCYFEIKGDILFSHYILHRNSLMDFIYRNRLPVNEEAMAEEQTSFWKYLETLKK